MNRSKTPLLSIRNLSSAYGLIEVLHNVSLDVWKGEIVSLLGANGAGKSTLLMCVSGIQPIRHGTISFDGHELGRLPAHERVARGLAQVPEGRRIFPRLSVKDNLHLGAYLHRSTAQNRETEDFIYSLFPILFDRQRQLGGTLSGGEQQMLAIGRALMSRPQMLLLDEPSMGIAPLLVQKIFESLQLLNQQGMTIFLIEQNAHLALRLSSRAYVLETGHITLQGDSSSLLIDPRIQQAYLGG